MRIDPIQLTNLNKLINDYRNNNNNIMQYFDYSPFHDYEKRVNDLQNRLFKREQLTDVLFTMNKSWDAPQTTFDNIEKLKNNNSVVVIGGQQAGLLTGPLYTINKIISIIQFARQREKSLKVPVIPVFWIAGEDHDFDEINHVFLLEDSKMTEYRLLQNVFGKYPISDIVIDDSKAHKWLQNVIEQLKETEYTKDLYQAIKTCLKESNTYVDFFARLIYHLFDKEGLVLMDSDHRKLRQIESEYFVNLIENQQEISTSVYNTFQQLSLSGYSIALDVQKNDAHLFYHHQNERIILEKSHSGDWVGKQNEVKFSTEEIIRIARETPELLSNNVVSRPLMQELLFPTLAFIGGNGEIGYWSVLKQAFHLLNMEMPPVLPRLSFTYINSNVHKLLEEYSIKSEDAINYGVEEYKGNWLASQHSPPIHHMVDQLKVAIDRAHKPLRNIAVDIRSDIGELSKKNLHYIFQEIDFLENRMISAVEEKFKNELATYDLINNKLHPNNSLQERIWNPISLINNHGTGFLKKLLKENCSFEHVHYLVHI